MARSAACDPKRLEGSTIKPYLPQGNSGTTAFTAERCAVLPPVPRLRCVELSTVEMVYNSRETVRGMNPHPPSTSQAPETTLPAAKRQHAGCAIWERLRCLQEAEEEGKQEGSGAYETI